MDYKRLPVDRKQCMNERGGLTVVKEVGNK